MTEPHRTPLGRVRGLGPSRSGTEDFWHSRVTAVGLIPLTVAFVLLVISLLGRNQAAAQQILGTPLVAIVMLLFIGMSIYHMWIGMQEIVVDYIHDEFWKLVVLMTNTFFCIATGLACVFAIFKLAFGV